MCRIWNYVATTSLRCLTWDDFTHMPDMGLRYHFTYVPDVGLRFHRCLVWEHMIQRAREYAALPLCLDLRRPAPPT
jgi:hypothetical protein